MVVRIEELEGTRTTASHQPASRHEDSDSGNETQGWMTAVALFALIVVAGVYLLDSHPQIRGTIGDELSLPADSRTMMMTPLRRP